MRINFNSTFTCDYRKNIACSESNGVKIFGFINENKDGMKLDVAQTVAHQISYIIVEAVFAVIGMGLLALLGLICSLVLKLFGVDTSTLTNWFFDIFRFGTISNIVVAFVKPVLAYIIGMVISITTFIKRKRNFGML